MFCKMPGFEGNNGSENLVLWGMKKMNNMQIVGLVIVLLVLIFFLQNILGYGSRAYISFLFMRGSVQTGWLIFSCLLMGGIAGFLLGQFGRRK